MDLVRFPAKILQGWGANLTSVLRSPGRRGLFQATDKVAVTLDDVAVGIYTASEIDDDAALVTRDIMAILNS